MIGHPQKKLLAVGCSPTYPGHFNPPYPKLYWQWNTFFTPFHQGIAIFLLSSNEREKNMKNFFYPTYHNTLYRIGYRKQCFKDGPTTIVLVIHIWPSLSEWNRLTTFGLPELTSNQAILLLNAERPHLNCTKIIMGYTIWKLPYTE